MAEQGKAPGVPQPQPVEVGEDGPELVSKVSVPDGHKHNYQSFRLLGESRNPSKSAVQQRCPGCGHVKGSRD